MFKSISIIGFGRFGELWASFLGSDFRVGVYDTDKSALERARHRGHTVVSLEHALSSDAVFYAVPISLFESAIQSHLPLIKEKQPKLIADVLSVKVHPSKVMEQLPKTIGTLLLHPLFGPDSVKLEGFKGQPIVIDRSRAGIHEAQFWMDYFTSRELTVIEMSADEHDRLAARSQGITHFVGRMLERFALEPTKIDTVGARKLNEIKAQVCNDSWQLFSDLQTYNPHTLSMRIDLGNAQAATYNQLLPNRIFKDKLVVGIQGGRGSFNEEAARYYLNRSGVKEFELHYLHTSANVLRALHEGDIDRGQFAIHNSTGGIVHESVDAMAAHTFKIVEEFGIEIAHALLIHPEAELSSVTSIMTHPQVLRQCRKTLLEKYPRLNQTSGLGELVDQAKVAEGIASGELPKTISTMGSKALAAVYGLTIVEDNLQDLETNFTTFLWVERPSSI